MEGKKKEYVLGKGEILKPVKTLNDFFIFNILNRK